MVYSDENDCIQYTIIDDLGENARCLDLIGLNLDKKQKLWSHLLGALVQTG
jgi:hypothetical protein